MLELLHTTNPHIVSPLHGKRRNQEGSCTTSRQLPLAREMQTTRLAKRHAVLPQTTLGQITIAPWTDRPPTQGKKTQ
jgi:ABC-type hemin transport system ATPase subunit